MGGLFPSKEPSSQDDDVSDDAEAAPAQDTPETGTTSDAKMPTDDSENPF
jgi:hypothetical protein